MATNTIVQKDETYFYTATFNFLSAGSDESAVQKIDVSGLTPAASYLDILMVQYAIQGITTVTILFDATTDDVALYLPPGAGFLDFSHANKGSTFTSYTGLTDPQSTGTTGDVNFTTAGGDTVGDSYSITLWCRKN